MSNSTPIKAKAGYVDGMMRISDGLVIYFPQEVNASQQIFQLVGIKLPILLILPDLKVIAQVLEAQARTRGALPIINRLNTDYRQ